MLKLLLVLSVFAFAYGAPGVVVAPAAVATPVVHHHGAHAIHSHVIHHPAPVVAKAVVPVHAAVVKPVVPVVPVVAHHAAVVKPVVPVVPVVPVHHAHHTVVAHH